MAEDHNVKIVAWPAGAAHLEHHFSGETLPVGVSFESTPARVVVSTLAGSPLNVNMNMNLKALETIPLCIKLCEPICAESSYTIGISIFDRPVVSITIRGKTRLFGCREEY